MANLETFTKKPEVSFFKNETSYRLINESLETTLDSKLNAVEDYIKNNHGKGKSEEEKDELYGKAQSLHKEFLNEFVNAKYNLYLNRPQYRFLTDTIKDKLEYDVNTIFFAIELTDFLANAVLTDKKFTSDTDIRSFEVSATELTYTYHLLSKYKAKGLSNASYRFSEVLLRIGELSKVFNYYEVANKNLTSDVQEWAASFDENVSSEKFDGQVQAEVAKPSKKKEKAA